MTDRLASQSVHVKTRRVWLGVSDPDSPHRLLDENAVAALTAWDDILQSSSFCISLRRPSVLPVVATADAMATSSFAGFGGAVFFNDSTCVWYRFRIQLDEAQACWSWVTDSMQKNIAAWELLAQFLLTFCISCKLTASHEPVTCHQGTDNSATDAWLISYANTSSSCADHRCSQTLHMSQDIRINWQTRSADLTRCHSLLILQLSSRSA